MAKAKAKSFEEQLTQLEATVARLEQNELSLDETLKLYAQGVELARACREKLSAAEQVLSSDPAAAAPAAQEDQA